MKLFDSHCHLDDNAYRHDRDKILQRARQNGVLECMTVGVDQTTSGLALEIAGSHDGCVASVGIHPHYARTCSDQTIQYLQDLSIDPLVCAWGETGLDFNRMYSPRDDQEKWLVRQLHAAREMNLPLIFHERDSQGRFLEILHANPDPDRSGVIHCFSGDRAELEAYLDLGLHIGITGIITLKTRGDALRKLVREIPPERLLIETDAPYLTPSPEKNKTRINEPAFVKSVLLRLADVRQEDPETLARITRNNARRLFRFEQRLHPGGPQ